MAHVILFETLSNNIYGEISKYLHIQQHSPHRKTKGYYDIFLTPRPQISCTMYHPTGVCKPVQAVSPTRLPTQIREYTGNL